MIITYEPSTITLPNITVEDKYIDGVLKARRITANDGYVILDNNEVFIDPETGDEINYYFRQVTVNIRVPFENWGYEAVLESEVPADQIFGGGNDNDHEVMTADEKTKKE